MKMLPRRCAQGIFRSWSAPRSLNRFPTVWLVSKRAHFQPTQIQRHFAGYRRHGIFICGIAVGLGACLYGHHFVKAEARAATAEYDDETPDEEGEPNPADERQETFERLRAQILAEGGCVELDTNPVIHDHSLTWSTLHGPGRFEKVSMFYKRATQELVGVFHFGDNICGHKQIVHGGAIAVAFDESLGWLAHIVARQCFTAYLHVNYRTPLASSTLCVIRCRVRSIQGRKIHVEAQLFDHLGKLHADADALFVVPKSYQFHHPPPVTAVPGT